LAELYGVETRVLNQAVKRNLDRFPSHFMFQLTQDETENMVSQNVIPSKQVLGGFLPRVFSEHGVLMLANVLHSEKAVKVGLRIIEIFIKMREMMLTHKDLLLKIEQLERQTYKNTEDIQSIFKYLKQMLLPIEQVNRRRIGFKQED
jgi:hypothetical protein